LREQATSAFRVGQETYQQRSGGFHAFKQYAAKLGSWY
jgi:hypothetical protein